MHMALERLLQLWQGKTKKMIPKDGAEKREFMRLAYPSDRRPTLKVQEHELEVLDISEQGIKILDDKQIELNESISGSVVFSSGISLELTGKIKWQHENKLGLFVTPIPRSIILDEVRALLQEMSKDN